MTRYQTLQTRLEKIDRPGKPVLNVQQKKNYDTGAFNGSFIVGWYELPNFSALALFTTDTTGLKKYLRKHGISFHKVNFKTLDYWVDVFGISEIYHGKEFSKLVNKTLKGQTWNLRNIKGSFV